MFAAFLGPGPPRAMVERMAHALLFYDVVDDYIERRAPLRAEHLQLVREADSRGEIVMGGALADPVDGVVIVFRGADMAAAESAARAFAEADPYVANGLVKDWRVRHWMTVIGDGAKMP